jgi:hypothetical protein
MRKQITLAAMFMLLAIVFSGCNKKSEWSNFHGFTVDDVVGTYSWSNINDSFEGLIESYNCHLCDGANITITKSAENLAQFCFENETPLFNATIEDSITVAGNDFMIKMRNNPHIVSAYVLKDSKGRIRLHGFVRKATAENGPVNYYFDVIKD